MSEMYSKEQLAEMKEELIRELRKIYDDDDFVRGAIVFLPSENFIPHLLCAYVGHGNVYVMLARTCSGGNLRPRGRAG